MRFKDEKQLWHSDTEYLAKQLANKSTIEIQEILDQHDVIALSSTERPGVNIIGRLLLPVVFIVVALISIIKWIITGDRFIDSIAKRYSWFNTVLTYTGIK